MSRSLRARGLKLTDTTKVIKMVLSRSLRARGLKYPITMLDTKINTVALFTGAWIEIREKHHLNYH